MNAIVKHEKRSLIKEMAATYAMEPDAFAKTVQTTCMPSKSTQEEFAAFLLVAHQHGLNPITREIYAFPKKGGGIQPIVGIDGWMTLINTHPQSDGMEFTDLLDDSGNLTAITCRIYRKDRNRPTEVTEYMNECKRPTEPWQKWPARMLRHKAAIQCARYAFGFAGIIDPEEAERSPEVETGEVVAPQPPSMKDEIPHENAEPEIIETVFEPELFLAELEEAIVAADSEEIVMEVWESFDVEAALTDHEAMLQQAFNARKARLAQFEIEPA